MTNRTSPATPRVDPNGPYSSIPDLLASHHAQLRDASGLSDAIIGERGYRSTLGKQDFLGFGFKESQWAGPGMLIPTHGPDGQPGSYLYRPDKPKPRKDGKIAKYVNPLGAGLSLDVPPRCREALGDPTTPLMITEGVKKGDALATHGYCAVALNGVWGFKGKNMGGGVTLLADWDHVALNDRPVAIIFDSDVMTKETVRAALERLAEHIRRKGGLPRFVFLPPQDDGSKMGVDDYLLLHEREQLERLIAEAGDEPARPLAAEISWEDPPYPLVRPLDLHRGVACAVVPLSFKRTVRERQGKDGTIMLVDPPQTEWANASHVILFDGERRLLGPLAVAFGRPEDAGGDALRRLGVTVALDVETSAGAWSRDGIRAFLMGGTPNPAAVLEKLIAVLEHFMDYSPVEGRGRALPPSASSTMVALWILGTYFVPAAQVVGYLLPTGPAGSGKTKQLTLIGQLAYLGEVINQAGSNAALKYLAQSSATLCFDDIENIQDRTFDPDKRSIILAGNRRGVTVPIMELGPDKRWGLRRFPVFCPKAFSLGLPRCYGHWMMWSE